MTPEHHLLLIGEQRGILGHPKCFYDTMLNLNDDAVLRSNFNQKFDPYGFIRRVLLQYHSTDQSVER